MNTGITVRRISAKFFTTDPDPEPLHRKAAELLDVLADGLDYDIHELRIIEVVQGSVAGAFPIGYDVEATASIVKIEPNEEPAP